MGSRLNNTLKLPFPHGSEVPKENLFPVSGPQVPPWVGGGGNPMTIFPAGGDVKCGRQGLLRAEKFFVKGFRSVCCFFLAESTHPPTHHKTPMFFTVSGDGFVISQREKWELPGGRKPEREKMP